MSKPFEEDCWNDEAITELVRLAQDGCVESQQQLFTQLRSFFAYVANEQLEQKHHAKFGASDIVQQAMAKAVFGLAEYRGKTAAEFRGWLKQITVNEAKQTKRGFNADKRQLNREKRIAGDSQTSRPAIQLADSMMTPGTEAIAEEQAQAVNAALKSLRQDYQEVIKLRNWEGMTFAEIAVKMDVTESSAANLWYRGLIKLQDEFKKRQSIDDSI